ncbi:MAG: GSU2403 family nucleotidyltransferase fold protein [Nitrospirota bacterium]
MEKRYVLFLEVLRRFQAAGLLKELILIGSWCQHFYRSYFTGMRYTPTIRTRDMDFLVPVPFRIKNKVDVEELLRDEGFVVTFSGGAGYMKLMHPELIVEFLVPEKGKGSDRPYPLPQLGMNAQPLRFLDYLLQNTIRIEEEGLKINVPHPAAFALHKLIISARRTKEEKLLKDRKEALAVLTALVRKGDEGEIKSMLDGMPSRWKKRVIDVLTETDNIEIMKILK